MIIHIHLPDDNDTYALGVVADLLNAGYRVTVDLDPIVEADDLTSLLSQAIDRAWEAKPVNDDRQAVYDARYAEAEAARIVPCPSCRAQAGMPCTTPSGKAYGAFAHVDRIQAAHAWVAHA